MAKRIASALAASTAIALLSAREAVAASGLDLTMSVGVERGRYPDSGFEIGLMAGGVVILIAIGFLLRYLSRPRRPEKVTTDDKVAEGEAANDKTPGDERA